MGASPADSQSLEKLKDLLLSPEKKRLQAIENRLDDPLKRAREISRTLPDAISMSVMEGKRIAKALHPVIDDSLKESVKNNPKALADAIFPALGPGIRKAISATIMGMIQSMNQVLNRSFSVQGLKWRFEAFKTRKPFAEIVLLNTLVYQVEQIFLIHGDTGIVLEHVVAQDAFAQDPDLVSGMLTAIQDFVRDSFKTDTGDDLDMLRIGSSRSVWIEKGDQALVAAVIRGTPPMELRTYFRELVDEVHLKAGAALNDFEGDPTPFAIFREAIKDGLRSQEKQEKKKTSPLLWLMAAGLILLVAFGGYSLYTSRREKAATVRMFRAYLGRLEESEGIIPISHRQTGKASFRIRGFRDPLAAVPGTTPEEKKRFAVEIHWQPYYSLDPDIVLRRARNLLTPPDTVTLELAGDTLSATGEASREWIRTFRATAPAIPGISKLGGDKLVDRDLEREKKTQQLLESYLKRLDAREGIVPVSTREKDGIFEIRGLKDPLAEDPANLLAPDEKQHLRIRPLWQPYYSLAPDIVLKRACQILAPPESIRLEMAGNSLAAYGRASHEWLTSFRKTAAAIPGVAGFSDDRVIDTDRETLDLAMKNLRDIRFYFRNNRTDLIPDQASVLDDLPARISAIESLAAKLGTPVKILIRGHTDSRGDEKFNLQLSRKRAQVIYGLLTDRGVSERMLTTTGVGTQIPLAEETDENARQFNRAVSFTAFYNEQTKGNTQ